MRVKICGLTQVEDVRNAVRAGADALGFVFYQPSKRAVSIECAEKLATELPPFVQSVGLFVNAEAGYVREVLARVPLDCLQFHGSEPPAFCEQFHRRWIKAVPMRDLKDAQAVLDYVVQYKQADGFLLDAYGKENMGGSGETFDWQAIPVLPKPWILAGGLDEYNVAKAVQFLKPWAVDVSSGVEFQPARKSFDRMCRFITQARGVR